MTDSTPLVSVVIPTYGRDTPLHRSVNSVLDQTYEPTELIVVDDHSPVPAEEILESDITEQDNLTLIRHESNRGANAARKTGIDAATGEYIAFLDDDDEWLPTKLEKQVTRSKETGAEVVYTWVSQVVNGEVVAGKTASNSGDVLTEFFLEDFIGTFSAVMIHRSVINRAGYPDTDFPSWQDWDYFIRLAQVAEFAPVTERLVRRHTEGQDRISDEYETKNFTSAKLLLDKHEQLAAQHSMDDIFRATVEDRLGRAAVTNKKWRAAQRHFFRALRSNPRRKTAMYFASVIGGPLTFYPLQQLRRWL